MTTTGFLVYLAPISWILAGLAALVAARRLAADVFTRWTVRRQPLDTTGRVVVWVVLAGLFHGMLSIPWPAAGSQATPWPLLVPDTVLRQLSAVMALVLLRILSLVGSVAWLALLAALFGRLGRGWSVLGGVTAWPRWGWLRLLLAAFVASLMLWPLSALTNLTYALIVGRGAAAESGTPLVAIKLIGSVAGYLIGLWLAVRFLGRLDAAGHVPKWLSGRSARFAAAVALAGVVGEGIGLLLSRVTTLVGHALFAAGALSAPVGTSQESQAVWASQFTNQRALLDALPLVAYIVAAWLLRRVDWSAIEERTGWYPAWAEELAVFLVLAAWVTWPFSAPASIAQWLALADPGARYSPLLLAVGFALAFVFFVYRPAGGDAEEA